MAGEKIMENPAPVTAVLKSEAVTKLDVQDQPSGKLGVQSDSTSKMYSSTHPPPSVKGESRQVLVGEPGVNQPSSFYNYYYPGYDGSFAQSDEKGYFHTDGSHTGLQSENGSLVYFLPGYSPYATGTLMGIDGQCVGQQPYFSSGFFQPPVSYGSEAMPCYSWDSTYAGDISNGNFDGYGNVNGSGAAFGKSNGFNSMKTNGVDGAKLSKSTYSQPTKPLSKGSHLGSDLSAGFYKGYYPVAKSPFNNRISQHNGPMNYRSNGRGWNQHDRYKKSNRNVDFENSAELTRGPRAGNRAAPLDSSVKKEDLGLSLYKDKHNFQGFQTEYENAKFFIIKSYSEDDVHKSMKYDVWSSTPNGNRKLDAAFQEAEARESESGTKCPIFLFFSVNGSGQFVGVAEMIGKVDFNKDMDFWQMDKWNGFFPVKWHVIKDVPNKELSHIILENNENRSVTYSRDTQEIGLKQGLEMLKILKSYFAKTSLIDDFVFYENREKTLNAKKNCKQATLRYKEYDLTKQAKAGERKVEEDLRKTNKTADATSLINLTTNLSLNGCTKKSIAVKNPIDSSFPSVPAP